MIFSVKHIGQIIMEDKTQTRRSCEFHTLPRYKVGKTYAIQSGRGKKALPFAKIKILDSKLETENIRVGISKEDAEAEGGYTPEEFEVLFKEINPRWKARWAYTFELVIVDTKQSKEEQK